MSSKLIIAENISKTIAGRQILAVSHFELRPGEVAAIYGPNGAGKSSFLRILALIDHDYQGELRLFGKVPGGARQRLELRRRTAMVLDQPVIYRGTVRDNIAMGLRYRRAPADLIEERVNWALDLLNISSLRNNQARDLSRGQAQRVSLARALAVKPEILFLDEPFSGLDAAARKSLLADLEQWLRRDKQATIYVSHDRLTVTRVADRIIYLENGWIKPKKSAIKSQPPAHNNCRRG